MDLQARSVKNVDLEMIRIILEGKMIQIIIDKKPLL
jgi:hypothetical protein